MLSLYEIGVRGIEISRILTETEGELTPELEARIDQIVREGPEAVEAAAMVVRGLEASSDACIEEVKRLSDRAKSFHNNAERLKGYIAMALDTSFGGRVKTARFTVWTQKAPDTVAFDLKEGHRLEEITDSGFVRQKLELDKTALHDAFKRGQEIPGIVFMEQTPGKRYARIR